jgi:Tfp pilus assembly protein PilO
MSTAKSKVAGASVVKIYLAGVVACAVVSAGTYFVGVRPAMARYAEHRDQQVALRAARQKAAALLGTRNSTQGQLNAASEALQKQVLRLEPVSRVNQRLSALTELATRECGLIIDEMRPGTIAEGADYTTVPILIAGSGTYPKCARFLHRLRQAFPDTSVRSFETTNNSASPDSPAATFQFELTWHAAKG